MTKTLSQQRTVLYFVTSSLSARFLTGQLGFLQNEGFRIVLAMNLEGLPPGGQVDPGVRLIHVPFERDPRVWQDLLCLIKCIRIVRQVKPDVVNSSTPKAALLGSLAAALCFSRERVYVVRGLRFETMTGTPRRLAIMLERLTMRLSTAVVFNSNSLRDSALRHDLTPKRKTHILANGSGNGVDFVRLSALASKSEARQTLGIGDSGPVVGYVGRMGPDKGTDDLVAAFEALPADLNCELLIVGTIERGRDLNPHTSRALEENPRIHVFPWTEDPAIFYKAMDLFAFPSYREGLPNAPVEAQFLEVPVVGYAATGTVDAVRNGETGSLVEVGNVRALTDEMERLLLADDLRRRYGAAGRTWVAEHFSQHAVWSSLASLYRRDTALTTRRDESSRPD